MHGKNDISEGIGWPSVELAAALAVSYVILFFILYKGVASSGKSAYITALFPYFVLFILLIKGFTLPGAMDGILFYIKPDFSALLTMKVSMDSESC